MLYLQNIPDGLREPLLAAFNEIVGNFREGRWEPSELNGGKLCEVVYTIVRGFVDGTFPAKPSKPKNMVDACKTLELEKQEIRAFIMRANPQDCDCVIRDPQQPRGRTCGRGCRSKSHGCSSRSEYGKVAHGRVDSDLP